MKPIADEETKSDPGAPEDEEEDTQPVTLSRRQTTQNIKEDEPVAKPSKMKPELTINEVDDEHDSSL